MRRKRRKRKSPRLKRRSFPTLPQTSFLYPVPSLLTFVHGWLEINCFSVRNLILTSFQWDAIKTRLALPGATSFTCSIQNHALIYDFFSKPEVNLLLAWVHDGQLHLSYSLPPMSVELLTFFICNEATQIHHGDVFEAKVQTGSIQRDLISSLYHLMDTIYSPLLVRNPVWPASVRNEFSSGMNRLLSVLTDEVNRGKGYTVLYVPNEDLSAAPTQLAGDKELLQRLEATVIHWTRQIKDVLNSTNQEKSHRPNDLPLEEIEYWRSRVDDLSGISQQLDKPGVDRIEVVLAAAKSSYLAQFKLLATQIKDGMAEAQSNVKFLSVLKEPCTAINKSDLTKLGELLPTILDLVRLIWMHSPYYNTRERITTLLQKVSNAIIKRCCDFISLGEVFDGDVLESTKAIKVLASEA